MGGCIRACCASEMGLRCHSAISMCGIVYFGFMYLIFERQNNFFEFHVNDPDGTKNSCLVAALIWLLFLIIIMIQLIKFNKKKKQSKTKVSVAGGFESDNQSSSQSSEYRELVDDR